MKIFKNPNAIESYLFQSVEEALKINFLVRQIVYFRRNSPLYEIVFLNNWIETEDTDIQEITILEQVKLLVTHLKIEIDSNVEVFVNADDSSCFLIKKAGKCIQVDKKFHSLCDESDSLFLNNNYNLSKPEMDNVMLLNTYHEILKKQEGFIYTFLNNERALY